MRQRKRCGIELLARDNPIDHPNAVRLGRVDEASVNSNSFALRGPNSHV